ncbi:MAG: hypothetical protein JWM27_1114 [Gemmatimonadetes bacterium]|nr:hypothetical protein [Gemmatimonadota bacterium]
MRAHTLKLDELAVESFATTADAPSRSAAMDVTTKWPMDCPETLPAFCPVTAFA